MSLVSGASSPAMSLSHRLKSTAARAQEIEAGLGPHIEDQVLLKVDSDLSSQELQKLADDYGASLLQELRIPKVMEEAFDGRLLVLQTGPGLSEAQTIAAIEGDERVLLAATNDELSLPNPKVLSSLARGENEKEPPVQQPGKRLPNDLHPEQWALHNQNVSGGVDGADISAPEAWSLTTGGGKNGPIVAVVDSGIDVYHEDLKSNSWVNPKEIRNGEDDDWDGFTDDINGLNAVDGTGNIIDEVGHGTHVAGIIGAQGDNGTGITGVNWDTQLLGVKISDGDRVSLLAAISGTLYAAEKGARIANHSWGGPRRNPILEDVIESSPMLHVCAAGNSQKDSDQTPFYPAAFDSPNVISVGATTRKDEPLYFSNWGPKTVDLHAPGARVYSSMPVHKYDELSGTSMAAPHVSGVAALVASKFPEASNQEIKDRLMFSSDPLETLWNKSVTGGRLNAHSALEQDRVAPSDISDLAVSSNEADGLSFSWSGVGDDGMEGKAARYQVELDYGTHKEQLMPRFPGEAGSKEEMTFRTPVSESDRAYTLRVNAVDNVGNRSAVATMNGVMPAATMVVDGNFDSQGDGWTADGSWGKVEEEGRGLVYTDSPEGPHVPGSDSTLWSPTFNLKGKRSTRLTFDAKMMTQKYDFLITRVSIDGGKRWKHVNVLRLDRTPGYGEWGSYSVDLSAYDGEENVQLRFDYEPSNKSKDEGVFIDRVKVLAAEPGSPSNAECQQTLTGATVR